VVSNTSSRIHSRIFHNPVDEFAPGVHAKSTQGKQSGEVSSSGGAKNKHHKRDLNFDLPHLDDDFELDEKGADPSCGFGNGLKRYINKKTRMPRAVLSIRKASIPPDVTIPEVRRQLESLCKLDHPNILPFRECYEDKHHLKLVYDWCDGGLLLHNIWRYEGKLTEGHIAQVIREVLAALAAAHSFGVHHLDIGLFSLFVGFSDRLSPIKLFGLGLAGTLIPVVTARKVSRTNKYYYASPEMFAVKSKGMSLGTRHASDIWSVGTLLFTICAGRPPFGFGTIDEVSARVQGADWEFGLEFSGYSVSLKEMIESLLTMPANRRPTAQTLLKHAWLSKSQTMHIRDGIISQVAFEQLNNFAQMDHVKQTVARLLTDIGIAEDCYADLEEKFRELDLNGDGTITLAELMEVASTLPSVTPEMVDIIIEKLDRNGNCNVDISEFVAALVMEQDEADERLIRKAFCKMDKNGDARVTKKELFGVLRQYSGSIERQEISKFVGTADADGDQKMDYREFMGLFPQIKDKYMEVNKRISDARASLNHGQASLSSFRETLGSWLIKLEKARDKLEIACGVQEPTLDHYESNYSYEKGHLTEFDVQGMILGILDIFQDIPGHTIASNKRRARETRKAQAQAQMQALRGTEVKNQIMGLPILGQRVVANNAAAQELQALRPAQAGEVSGSDDDVDRLAFKKTECKGSAVNHFLTHLSEDRKQRMGDPSYRADDQIHECLYWLMKVKSNYRWQQPIIEVLRELREAGVEDIIEVSIKRKFELTKLHQSLTETYTMRTATEFGEDGKRVPTNARLMPLMSFAGENFKAAHCLDGIEDMKLPVHAIFASAKEMITHQKVEFMQTVYKSKMGQVGQFLTAVLQSIRQIFAEVEEDLKMSCSLEGAMPTTPPMSHLYLPHCQGREVQGDARTPRSDEDRDDDGYLSDNTATGHGHTAESVSLGSELYGGPEQTLGSQGSFGGATSARSALQRIERNQVLTENTRARKQNPRSTLRRKSRGGTKWHSKH